MQNLIRIVIEKMACSLPMGKHARFKAIGGSGAHARERPCWNDDKHRVGRQVPTRSRHDHDMLWFGG